MYVYIYVVILYALLFENVTKYKLNYQTFKIWLYFDFFTNLLQTDKETKSVKTIYN